MFCVSEILPVARENKDVWTEHMVWWRLGNTSKALHVLLHAEEGGITHAPAVETLVAMMERQPQHGAAFKLEQTDRLRLWHLCALAYARCDAPHMALDYLQRIHDVWSALPIPPTRFRAQWQRHQWQSVSIASRQVAAVSALLCSRAAMASDADTGMPLFSTRHIACLLITIVQQCCF